MLIAARCPKFLDVLGRFYPARGEPLDAELIDPAGMPEPHHGLLVHSGDMTSRLAQFHGERPVLRVLERVVDRGILARHIVLECPSRARPVEYGAARIHLDTLDEPARREVLEGHVPLGGILKGHGVAFHCCPGGYFRIRSNSIIANAFGLTAPHELFGRCNCLWDAFGRTIAEVVEVLPPEPAP
jgi:hypothetical protein